MESYASRTSRWRAPPDTPQPRKATHDAEAVVTERDHSCSAGQRLVCLGQAACAAGEAQNSPGKQGGVSVTTTLALRQTQPIELEANGYVMSLNSVDIHPQISNVIASVHVKEGQFVKAGEVLFTLDERSDRANLLKAEAQLAKDRRP